jgi:hypothetical protein
MNLKGYKLAAKASHSVKLKSMGFAGGGNVNIAPGRQPVSPIWKSVPPALPSGAVRLPVSPPISKATAPLVPVSSFATGGNVPERPSPVYVTRGVAAEREMAQMEKKAKAAKSQRRSKKG